MGGGLDLMSLEVFSNLRFYDNRQSQVRDGCFFFPPRHAVCIFYLVLRALDTIEDDMTISLDVKVPMLHEFHSYLYQPEWKYMESKEKDRQVLEDFPTVRCPPLCFSCLVSPLCARLALRVTPELTLFLASP